LFDDEIDVGLENHWTPSPARDKTCTLSLVCSFFCFTTSF
jgi:hypothetical protein